MSTERNGDDLVRIVLIVLAVIVLAPVLMLLLAVPVFGMWGGMMGGFGGSTASPMWGIGMSLFWLVVLLGVGYLVYRALAGRDSRSTDPAMEELRLAYARGELSEEEFDDRSAKLRRE